MVDHQRIVDLLAKHEGFRATCYRDTRGFLTVGIGFNLDAPGAADRCAAAGVAYQAVRAGMAITRAQADALLDAGIENALDVATIVVPGFVDLPDVAQLVVVDMIFNLGSLGFGKFRNLITALRARDWAGAAAAMKDSEWYGQVGVRAMDDVQLMLSAAG